MASVIKVNVGDAFLFNLTVGTVLSVLYVVVESLDDGRVYDRRLKCLRFATDNEEAHLLIRREDYLTKMLEHDVDNVHVQACRYVGDKF